MAVIDSKGRIFGKINILDLIVLVGLIIILVAGARYVAIKYIFAEDAPELQYGQSIILEIGDKPYYIVSNLEIGDQIIHNNKAVGEISRIKVQTIDQNQYHILLTLNIVYTIDKGNVSTFMGKRLLIGENFDIRTNKISLRGVLVAKSEEPLLPRPVEKIVMVIVRDKEDWFVNSIQPDTSIYSQGKMIAQIQDIEVSPSKYVYTNTTTRELDVYDHPYLYDMLFSIRIQATEADGRLTFNENDLKIGNTFRIFTDDFIDNSYVYQVGSKLMSNWPNSHTSRILKLFSLGTDSVFLKISYGLFHFIHDKLSRLESALNKSFRQTLLSSTIIIMITAIIVNTILLIILSDLDLIGLSIRISLLFLVAFLLKK